MFGYHVSIPRIPGRPLGCCKECRQRARWNTRSIHPDRLCKRCGLSDKRVNELLKIKKFVVFEDSEGNEVTKIRLK